MIKVLVVEDSPSTKQLIVHILNSDPEINVIGAVSSGESALWFIKKTKPDAITMDINLPEMNGLETTRRIMETNPVPIIIISSSWDKEESINTFKAMKAGALTCLGKPAGMDHKDYKKTSKELVKTVKAMSEVKLVRRWSNLRKAKKVSTTLPEFKHKKKIKEIKIVAIGASTGGPMVLELILSKLSKDFPIPILAVQHIAPGFVHEMVKQLSKTVAIPIRISRDGEKILPGHIYFAPSGNQMGVGNNGLIKVTNDKSENYTRPSVSYLFRSIANIFGENAVGILLTGMGSDGVKELKLMREKGAITIVQNKESCIVFGMPGRAVNIKAAKYVLPPEKITEMLKSIVINMKK